MNHWPSLGGLQVGWGAIFALLNLILGGGAFATWLKNRPKMRELEQSGEQAFIKTLSDRVATLERKLDDERLRHDAEASLLRHRAGNSDQCIDALLLVLETAEDLPEKVKLAVRAVKDMRARQKQEEALEKGAMRGGALQAAYAVGTAPAISE